MRVVTLVGSVSRLSGGPFVSVRRLAQELHRAGVDVNVFGVTDMYTACDLSSWDPVFPACVDRLFRRRAMSGDLGGFCYAPKLRGIVAQQPYDILHLHGIWSYLSLLAKESLRRNKPFVISPRGMLEPWALKFHRWKKQALWTLWEKQIVNSAAVLHATSNQEKASIRSVGARSPIAVIPNGVDIPLQSASHTSSGKRKALFLSRIHPKKGLLDLVAAWQAVQPPDWECIIAGPDEDGHCAEVRAAVAEAGLASSFRFAGPVYGKAKEDLFLGASLFVLPSHSENFAMAVAEALSYGLPVITTTATPWKELETFDCGWWVEPTQSALAKALAAGTSASANLRREMGRRGRKLIETRYCWPRVAEQMASVYRWIQDRDATPACVDLAIRQ
jgi:glycosyltransferase involved in cell wall biosynthesis